MYKGKCKKMQILGHAPLIKVCEWCARRMEKYKCNYFLRRLWGNYSVRRWCTFWLKMALPWVCQKDGKYPVEQKNGVRGCYRAGSCWHTVFLHSTVQVNYLRPENEVWSKSALSFSSPSFRRRRRGVRSCRGSRLSSRTRTTRPRSCRRSGTSRSCSDLRMKTFGRDNICHVL